MFDGILGYIVGGAVIGILARLLKPGADPLGWIMTIVLGIAGAVAGSYLSGMFGVSGRYAQWGVALVCAILLLFLYEMARRKPAAAA
ncbi:MAG TPA: GlsB/YeaQ/YmgE family stress response membrane protein [Xanthomonadaceae bacterium]|nr:GlsB/YeaQ/YmgE family stress response membrane protein [Xanthomonadaceae bacterium]